MLKPTPVFVYVCQPSAAGVGSGVASAAEPAGTLCPVSIMIVYNFCAGARSHAEIGASAGQLAEGSFHHPELA